MKISKKSGLTLGDLFPAVLVVAIISILFVAVIYLFTQFGNTFTANSAASNATVTFTTQFANQIPLIGLVLTIVLIAGVIGVLVSSFFAKQGERV